MAIILDLKDAIRNAIYKQDDAINFNFNEIQVVEYPYIFFYIPSFKLEKDINNQYWRKLTLMCVVEYAKSENNNETELWAYMETMSKAYDLFDFLDTKLSVQNAEFKTVDGVLQMTFNLEFYVKEIDETELMEELDLTIKIGETNGINSTEI